jgi:hypothetical protein
MTLIFEHLRDEECSMNGRDSQSARVAGVSVLSTNPVLVIGGRF